MPKQAAGEDAEPAPLVPARSDRLRVRSACHPSDDACRSNGNAERRCSSSSACFGPRSSIASRRTPMPSPRVREFSPPPPEEFEADHERDVQGPAQLLHQAVWLADWQRAVELLRARADVNGRDHHGATPLMLAVQLLPRAGEYNNIIQRLLESDADPRHRSTKGWSPIDEAVSQGDERLVRVLFDSAQQSLQQRWERRLDLIAASLRILPDFECTIRWEFESPVLPLLSKIAPSDVLRLTKRGTNLRVDSTLASWKRFRFSKRRDLTTLFRGGDEGSSAVGNGCGQVQRRAKPSLCMVNHSKQTVVNVTEGLDSDETGAVLGDLVSADVVQWDMQMDCLEVAEATTWLGAAAGPCDVNGWCATRFDVRGTLGMSVRRKGLQKNCMTFQDYFGCSLPADACVPELRAEFGRETSAPLSRETTKNSDYSVDTSEFVLGSGPGIFDRRAYAEDTLLLEADSLSDVSEALDGWSDSKTDKNDNDVRDRASSRPAPHGRRCRSGSRSAAMDPAGFSTAGMRKSEGGDRIGKTTHRVSASVWLARDFAFSMEDFLPVLEALAVEHEAMRRLKDLLNSQRIREVVEMTQKNVGSAAAGDGRVFPVRASIPLNIAVRAIVHIEAFQVRAPGSLPTEPFEIPRGYSWVSRREAQKTPKRAKKRTLLANLAL